MASNWRLQNVWKLYEQRLRHTFILDWSKKCLLLALCTNSNMLAAFDNNGSLGVRKPLNIVLDFRISRPGSPLDSLIFEASSEIVKYWLAFCPQHRACRLNNKFTFYQNFVDWYKRWWITPTDAYYIPLLNCNEIRLM